MIRRARRVREIPFSFDSFLDVVANVVGIIIRLILVVWVGARSYSSVQEAAKSSPAGKAGVEMQTGAITDPLQNELEQHRRELGQLRLRLLEQLRQLQQVKEEQIQVAGKLTAVSSRQQGLEGEQTGLERVLANHANASQRAGQLLGDLRQRRQKLSEEIRAVEQLPVQKQVLRYRTPVSQVVHTDEFFFELQQGRVAFIDIAALLAEVRQAMEERGGDLRRQWQLTDSTMPVGAFRLRYTMERQRQLFDAVMSIAPDAKDNRYYYGVTGWEVEPVLPVRGETIERALAKGSQFRQVADVLDPELSTVTFWVYPDSFALFRQLRDYLYERGVTVAGRPKLEGTPIAASRHGTRSRGQ